MAGTKSRAAAARPGEGVGAGSRHCLAHITSWHRSHGLASIGGQGEEGLLGWKKYLAGRVLSRRVQDTGMAD